MHDVLARLAQVGEDRSWLEQGAHSSSESLVSVVIPHHNNGPFIAAAVQSAVDQTWPNIEIVLVDDHSEGDHWAAACHAAGQATARGKLVTSLRLPRRCGTAWAQNIGYYISNGGFICNLDSDDVMAPEKVQRQVELAVQRCAQVVGTSYRCFKDTPGDLGLADMGKWLGGSREEITNAYHNNQHKVCWGTVLMRRRVLDVIGGNTKRFIGAEDFEIVKRIVDAGFRVENIPEPLYWYRQHPGQRSKLFHQ